MKCLLPICMALLIAGCQTPRELTAFASRLFGTGYYSLEAKGVSLVCEAVCARSPNGAVLVRLYKQSPAPLAEFRLHPENYFMANARLAGRGWTGPAAGVPAMFSSWVAFLTAYRESASSRRASGRSRPEQCESPTPSPAISSEH